MSVIQHRDGETDGTISKGRMYAYGEGERRKEREREGEMGRRRRDGERGREVERETGVAEGSGQTSSRGSANPGTPREGGPAGAAASSQEPHPWET